MTVLLMVNTKARCPTFATKKALMCFTMMPKEMILGWDGSPLDDSCCLMFDDTLLAMS